MKTSFKRLTALLLALVLTLSLLSAAAIAADAPDYAHLRIGTASGQPGDTVKVPVYLEGLKEGEECRGLSANVALGENLTLEGAEWTDLVSGFGYKICNKESGLLNVVNITTDGYRISADGKLCDLLVKIADDATAVGTVSLTNVSISGKQSTDFLNSTDGTQATVDPNAVVTPVDANGDPAPVISLATQATYKIVAEADKDTVEAGETVNVTVKVVGGEYAAVMAALSYDSDKFELTTAAAGWTLSNGKYQYYRLAGKEMLTDAELGTFVFTAKAQTTDNAVGEFTLSNTQCTNNWDDGATGFQECAKEDASVTIKLKTDLDVTAENKVVTYNGEEQSFNAVTSTTTGAVIKYGEVEGTYDLTAVTSKKDASDTPYELYYEVTAPGYAPKTGKITLTIKRAEIEYTATGYTGAYDNNEHTIGLTVTKPTTGVTITYSTEENGTYSDTAPTRTDVGTTTVWFKIDAGSNYNEKKDSATITITEASITFNITANTAVTYDGEEHASATVNSKVPDDVTVKYTCNGAEYNDIPSFTEADTYTVKYEVTRANYTKVEGEYTFTINKADMTGYAVTSLVEATYDGNAHASATFTEGTPTGATVEYVCNNVTYNAIPEFTNVGKYTVSYTIKAPNGNYKDSIGSYEFEIKSGTIIASSTGFTGEYDGQKHSISVTVSEPEDTTISYRWGDSGEWTTTNPEFTYVGNNTIYWKVTKAGYTEATGSDTVNITPRKITITVDDKEKTIGDADPEFTYQMTGTLVEADDLGTITLTRGDGETAGTYTITASYTRNNCYEVTVIDGTLTITDADFDVELVEDYTDEYTLVLVYTNSNATFTYDSAAMYKLTGTTYKYKDENNAETEYKNVFGLVVKGAANKANVAAVAGTPAGTLDCSTLDVNREVGVNFSDAVAVQAVLNGIESYMTNYMDIVLKADVNHDKLVNIDDVGLIMTEVLK